MNRRGRLIVAAWLAIVAACAWLVSSQARFTGDLTAFLPDYADAQQKLLIDQLRDGVASRLLLIGLNGSSAQALAETSRNLASILAKDRHFSYISNGANDRTQADYAFIKQYRYLLSANPATRDFSAGGLSASLDRAVMLLASPAGALAKRVLPNDPTLSIPTIIEEWTPQQQPATQHGVWFSADGKRALLLAETVSGGFDIESQRQTLDALHRSFASARASPDVQIQVSGPSVFAVKARDVMHRDAVVLSLGALIVVVGVLLLAYRSIWLIVLSMLPVFSGILVAVASVSLGFGFVHAITLGFGITLLGEAVDYPTYLFTRLSDKAGIEETTRAIWPTLRLAALTTALGSTTMLLSSFTGIAQLGLFSMVGVGFAVLVTRWVLPQLVPRDFVLLERPILTSTLRRAQAGLARGRWLVLLLAPLAGLYLLSKGNAVWEDDLAALSPIAAADKQLDKSLRNDLGAPDVRYLIIISANDPETALQKSERLMPLLDKLRARGVLGDYDMAANYLPSTAEQTRRYQQLPDAAQISTNLHSALANSAFNPDFFGSFIAEIRRLLRDKPLVDRAALNKTAAGVKVNALLSTAAGETRALVPLYGLNQPAILNQALLSLGDEHIVALDLKQQSETMLRQYRTEALKYSAAGLAGIVLVLALGLRSLGAVLRVLTPVLIAILAITAMLVALGQQLSLFHIVSLLLVLGIGLNYALFFNERADVPSQNSLFSILICAATTISSFGILALSQTPILHAIGITVAGGAFAALLFSAALTSRPQALAT